MLKKKKSTCQCRSKRCRFDPWVGKIPLEKEMATRGQRTLAGYSPWGHKESDMTEYTHTLKDFGDISEDILFCPSHFCIFLFNIP